MDIHNLTFSYGTPTFIHELSLSIQKGAITTILGPNGSGKSTLLALMAKSLSPKSGEIMFDGELLSSLQAKTLAKKLAVVYQQNDAPMDLTVKKLTAYGRQPHRRLLSGWTDADEQAVQEALAVTNLLTKADVSLAALSGGERQRVWIAMALAQQSEMLLLDEPTTFLDLYYQVETLELIRQLNHKKKLTVVMVLHDLNQAIRYSDTLVVMNKGAIVQYGSPLDIMTKQLVKDVYGIDVVVRHDEDAGMVMLPMGL
ncbi:ABC transporter ATP-binding protein [Alkalicoccobacillus murimartini]|uniref:Iron complex transport system ATP-binding protein n=1 Tax=Alkalicoccobacillus murimartini TaxID=171685 RepID=A0ABT9YKK3_9BACI|nr:ABC transporter ATP-binding protein [Alkalicoccobacillus murimartini]MDQ0207747.1 iron complex transport system ATP-binding protein [Alkalicoccobacillus murimartini]